MTPALAVHHRTPSRGFNRSRGGSSFIRRVFGHGPGNLANPIKAYDRLHADSPCAFRALIAVFPRPRASSDPAVVEMDWPGFLDLWGQGASENRIACPSTHRGIFGETEAEGS